MLMSGGEVGLPPLSVPVPSPSLPVPLLTLPTSSSVHFDLIFKFNYLIPGWGYRRGGQRGGEEGGRDRSASYT